AQALEAVENVEITEIYHAKRHAQHDEAIEHLEKETLVAAHRFGEHCKIEMIIAPRRGGNADKRSIDEEIHRRFLQPQPRMADRAGDDVANNKNAECSDDDSAQDHQQIFEWVEYAPFQMTLFLQDQPVKTAHRSIPKYAVGNDAGSFWAPRCRERAGYFTLRTSWRTFSACGPRSLASLSWIGLLIDEQPLLSTFLTTFTPTFSSFAWASCSSLKAAVGSFLLTSSAAAWTHFFC